MRREATWSFLLRADWDDWRKADTGNPDVPAWLMVSADEPLDEDEQLNSAYLELDSKGGRYCTPAMFWKLVGQIIGSGKGELWMSCSDGNGGVVQIECCVDTCKSGACTFADWKMDDDKQRRIDAAMKILAGNEMPL